MATEKKKPNPPEEYEVVRLPMRNPVGGETAEAPAPTSGPKAAEKEG